MTQIGDLDNIPNIGELIQGVQKMSTLQADAARPTTRHAHKPNGAASDIICPYCGQPVSRKEFREIQARIEAEEKDRLAKWEKAFADKATAELQKAKHKAAELAQKEIDKVKRDAQTEVTKLRQQAQRNHDAIRRQATEAARTTVAAKVAEAVNAEKVRHVAEKLILEQQLSDMQRKLQAKTAHQLGEQPEIDLFEALVTAFPDDSVSRVLKGQKGPDVIVEINHSGAVVGKIVLDSKNRAKWSNKFTTKLRSDQLAESADFAILSTSVFPAGAGELYLQDHVIVASPQRVVVLTHLLRRQLVENHRLRLTAAARDEKAEKLLAYVVSPTCTDLLDRIVTLTRDMADLDRVETATHQKTCTKRADLIRTLHAIHEEFSSTISAIIAGDEGVAA